MAELTIHTSGPILHALTLDAKGAGQPLTDDETPDAVHSDALAWVHLDAENSGTRNWLTRHVGYLDSLVLDALLADETRPRLVEYGAGVLIILRGINLNDEAEPEDMVSVRLWVDAHRIISVRRRRLKAVQDIRQKLLHGLGPRNSGEFISTISARLFERMEPAVSGLNETLDELEEQVIDRPDAETRQAINALRKRAILFRRYIAPQRDVMAQLRSLDLDWLDVTHKRRLQENSDRLLRYVEDLDAARERAQIVKDELASALSDRLNKNIYILSIVAALFLPLGLLTGLLGINVGGIPGTDSANAFWIFSGILLGVGAAQLALFKFLRWF